MYVVCLASHNSLFKLGNALSLYSTLDLVKFLPILFWAGFHILLQNSPRFKDYKVISHNFVWEIVLKNAAKKSMLFFFFCVEVSSGSASLLFCFCTPMGFRSLLPSFGIFNFELLGVPARLHWCFSFDWISPVVMRLPQIILALVKFKLNQHEALHRTLLAGTHICSTEVGFSVIS